MLQRICSQCGKRINGKAKYCSQCGGLIIEKEQSDLDNSLFKVLKENRRKISIISAITCVLFVMLVLGICIFNNDYRRAIRCYKEAKTEKIQSLYEDMGAKDEMKMCNYLDKKAQSVHDDFFDSKIDYQTASDKLQTIRQSYPADMSGTAFTNLNKEVTDLNESRINYSQAESSYTDSDYEKAYNFYDKVIAIDPEYQQAQDKITEIRPMVAKQYYEKAKSSFDNHDYTLALSRINSALEMDDQTEYSEFKDQCTQAKEKNDQEQEEKERAEKLLTEGKEIKTSKLDLVYQGASLTDRILPSNTNSAYVYQKCPEDSIFLDMVFTLKNTSDYNAGIDIVKDFSTSYGTKKYSQCNTYYSESGSTTVSYIFNSTSIVPLKEVTCHIVVQLPYEATATTDSINVSFKIDNQEQLLEFR